MSIGGKGVAFFVTIVVFTVLCTLALLLRWWAARLQGRRFQIDDGLLIFAWVRKGAFVVPLSLQSGGGSLTSKHV